MVHWAEQIGPHTARLIERILSERPHPEMGYRSCLGIIRLADRYSSTRMEAAALRALESNACRFKSVESILKNSLDQQPFTQLPVLPPPPPHDNIRGGEYFE
jgi:transposase